MLNYRRLRVDTGFNQNTRLNQYRIILSRRNKLQVNRLFQYCIVSQIDQHTILPAGQVQGSKATEVGRSHLT